MRRESAKRGRARYLAAGRDSRLGPRTRRAFASVWAIVAGDFNLPLESAIYRRDWATLQNAFSAAGFGLGHTKRSRWFGIRIDHVLAGSKSRIERCWIGPDVGSDHRPLVAELTAADI